VSGCLQTAQALVPTEQDSTFRRHMHLNEGFVQTLKNGLGPGKLRKGSEFEEAVVLEFYLNKMSVFKQKVKDCQVIK